MMTMSLIIVQIKIVILCLVVANYSLALEFPHEVDDDYKDVVFDRKTISFIKQEDEYTTEHSVMEVAKTRDIYQAIPECPPLPEPTIENIRLCQAKKCQTNKDCIDQVKLEMPNQSSNLICCFNGCVHTCLTQVDPPPVFDWIEETNLKNLSKPSETEVSQLLDNESSSSSKENLFEQKEAEEIIAIPGGCMISSDQYESLLQFRKNKYINSCICVNKDIVCNITQEHE